MTALRNKKCKACRCWRKDSEFIRREKKWDSCNVCSDRHSLPKKSSVLRFEACVTAIRKYGFQYNELKHRNATFILEREPTNKFDKNAIKVLMNDKQIGYIKATDAVKIAPLLDNMRNYEIQNSKVLKYTEGYLVMRFVISC